MRRDLGPDDVGDLLERPLVAVLATYRRDGSVLLSPVWHRWHEGGFDVVVGPNDVKLRHLRRDPRASVLVYENEPPYRGLEARGRARLVPDDGSDALGSMAVRYLGPEDGPAYVATAGHGVLVRLEPSELRAWDFSDEWSGEA